MWHYSDFIMSAMASQITGVSIVCSNVGSGTNQRKQYESSMSLAFVRGIHWWPVDSHHRGPVTWNMFPFDDVIMNLGPTLQLPMFLFWSMHSTKFGQKFLVKSISSMFSDIFNVVISVSLTLCGLVKTYGNIDLDWHLLRWWLGTWWH